MIATPKFFHQGTSEKAISFWERLFSHAELRECAPLEKLLVGCELIAALDGAELLAA